jgi:type IV pilus assembly protein PilV
MQQILKKNCGFTLIEVLIAVLVLSIGLLGLAGLQAVSLRSNHSGLLRSQANILAYDLIDRMRANRNAALSTSIYLMDFDEGPDETATNCESASASCGEGDTGAFDKNQWKCMLGAWNSATICTTLNISGVLPGGQGNVTRDVNNVYTVEIRYDEREGSLNADTTTIQVRAQI